ncbi:methylated-DNA--[protein]-cysteine S-methyltransferase [Halovenus marina]|uniref:methylated-DNA--[protein]-cysteine S-methyltransferase n=1 Tax=Halovenus marina TaxID=3396621 RepID=UPI003F558D97
MEDAGIYARKSGYLDRYVQVGIAQGRVISVSFPVSEPDDAGDTHELLDRIESYLNGARDDFSDVQVAMTMETDHRAVLEAVREVGYGQEQTVEGLTRMVPGRDPDEQSDRTLVREALAANPVPLLIPDHRIRDGPSGAPPDVEQKFRSVEGLA